MAYYAHTATGKSEDEWKRPRHHLSDVAVFAAERAMRFGAGEMAHAAGLHDLGKYSPAFQARLRPSRPVWTIPRPARPCIKRDQELPYQSTDRIETCLSGVHHEPHAISTWVA